MSTKSKRRKLARSKLFGSDNTLVKDKPRLRLCITRRNADRHSMVLSKEANNVELIADGKNPKPLFAGMDDSKYWHRQRRLSTKSAQKPKKAKKRKLYSD